MNNILLAQPNDLLISAKLRDSNIYKKDIFNNKTGSLYIDRIKFFRLYDRYPDKRLILHYHNLINGHLQVHYANSIKKYSNRNPFYQIGNEFYINLSWLYEQTENDNIIRYTTAHMNSIQMININCEDRFFKKFVFTQYKQIEND